jgi:hypothetical protein
VAEVREFQQGESKQYSKGGSDNSDVVPMPVNWLSEVRDCLRQLRETNDFQKEECF